MGFFSALAINQGIQVVPQLAELGIRYVDHGDDWVELELAYNEKIIGYPETGVVAGGAIFTLMDNASGLAVFVARKAITPMATLDLRLDYLKPAQPGLAVRGRMECYKLTRKVGFVRGFAYHDSLDHPIAHATGTFVLSTVS